MKKTTLQALIITICIGIFLTSCSSQSQTDPSYAISIPQLQPAPLIAPPLTVTNPETTAVAHSANDFAFKLSAALLQNIQHENFVVSPFSVWMPLAALVNATAPQHLPALLESLGAAGISPEHINQAASRMLFNLTNENGQRRGFEGIHGQSPLHIANAILVDHNRTLNTHFAQTFLDYFRGEVISVDFNSRSAVDAINQWASDNTNGLIDEIIQDFDPDTIAAIANAIYFSGEWVHQFSPAATAQDIFHSPTGDGTAYFMRLHRCNIRYFEDEYVQAIDLPFTVGGGMYIILPRNGDAVGLLSNMTAECFVAIQENSVMAEGTLLLPRFSIENTLDELWDILKTLGVPLLDEQLDPITGLIDDNPLFISNAVQVAMIEIDEEGATAAAVTVMGMEDSAPPPPDIIFEMICNSPFVFILYGWTQDGGRQILFMGVVNQP